MARASRVRGIHPSRSLRENARKVVEVRLHELLSWRPALDDASRVQDLHDMRIAAKRLRYALETFQVCFPRAKTLLRDLTEIQEDLGDIHDLDVLCDVFRARLRSLEAPLEGQAVEIMGMEILDAEKSALLRRLVSRQVRDIRRLGLLGLLGDKVNERQRRFVSFRERWNEDRLGGFEKALLEATSGASIPALQPENLVTQSGAPIPG